MAPKGQDQPNPPAQQSGESAAIRSGTRINAELVTALDTRTAKVGDEVVAKATKDVKQSGRTVIHKGDRLLGRVTEVQSAASAEVGSRLAVAFDRLVHGETTTQLNAVIRSIISTPRQERAERERMMRDEPMVAPQPTPARSAPSGSPSAGGGLVGGATSTVGSVVGGATSTVGSTVGGAANTTVGAAGGTVDATTHSTLGTATGADLSTPINAIRIQSNAQGESQSGLASALSTRRGDLRLESGTRLQLQVAAESQAQAKSK
ncbi:MAG TPA: hypothetical protein VNN18_05125 [Candidatus Xenobia bacterium]|nr:hypothetical protein [Candidatus Xenobia bacterium]